MITGSGLVLLLIMSIALFPVWPFSRAWGYTPSAVTGVLLMGLIGLVRTGATL
ncbi:MAG TPA: DUF3309 family protein [Gemmatimonadota bacterium]|nr:DUF3309 family protein [Gemmatimonadota bacterium]